MTGNDTFKRLVRDVSDGAGVSEMTLEHYPGMTEKALAAIVAEEVANAAANGQTGPKAMGGVIKAVKDRVGASADGSAIASAVKAALT
jgi:uncharacterized protein YqeY